MLYFKYLKMNVKKVMQYRLSLLLSFLAQTLTSVMALLSIYFLFDRFKIVKGWTFSQIALSYAVVYLCFSFTECFFRGVDTFPKMVKSGKLDAWLLRPRGIFTQALCAEVEFSKIGRLVVALSVLIYACAIQPFVWNFAKIMVLISMMFCGVVMFLSLFLIGAAVSIFTVEGIEAMNILTDGGRDLCQYPVDIYGKFIQVFFTYIVPFACFNYLPMKFIFDLPGATIFGNALAPLYGMLFIIPAYFLFNLAIKKYTSTGS